MAIQFEDNEAFIIVHVSETFKQAELDAIKSHIRNLNDTQGKAKVLIMLDKNFISLEAGIDWSDTSEDEHLQKKIKQVAIVGDFKWKEQAFLFLLKGLVPISIEYFPVEQEALAKAWLS